MTDVSATDEWRDLAVELQEHGVPEKRAHVVALVASGRTHEQVKDELGLEWRSEVGTHVARYRERDLLNAKWLAEHGPEI